MARETDTNPISLTVQVTPGLHSLGGGVFVSPGRGRHPHRILDTWELILVERGSLGIAVDGVSHDLGPGEWVLMPAGRPHLGTREYPRELRFLWVHFRLPSTATTARRHQPVPDATATTSPAAAMRLLALPGHGHAADAASLSSLLRRLIDHHAGLEADPLTGDLLLTLALAELRAAPRYADGGEDLAARALRIIQARFRECLTTTAVARLLGVGADHLGRCFQRAHGHSVLDAINHHRLTEAQRLLLLGGGAISDVAAASGFPQAQWFRRLFQRRHGISPRAWRRLHARVHTNSS